MATNIRFLPPITFFKDKMMEMSYDLIPSFVQQFLDDKEFRTFNMKFNNDPINSFDYLYNTIRDVPYAGTPNYIKASSIII